MEPQHKLTAATNQAQAAANAGLDPALLAIIIQAAVAVLEWLRDRNK